MTEVVERVEARPRSRAVVWGVRIFLALVFLYAGAVKLPGERGLWVRLFEQIGWGQWFRYVTAAVEMIGGALMVWPGATPVAVFLIASAMVGALITHALVVGFGPPTVAVSVLLALTLWVGRDYLRRR